MQGICQAMGCPWHLRQARLRGSRLCACVCRFRRGAPRRHATAPPVCLSIAQVVLLKEVDDEGFIFYTNNHSRKGRELLKNPQVAMVMHWPGAGKQVRIEGVAEPLPAEASDAYFATRSRGSQLAAACSAQSAPLDSRGELLAKWEALASARAPPARPGHWGGWRVLPTRVEFWQDGEHRLHHRLLYTSDGSGGWLCSQLQP